MKSASPPKIFDRARIAQRIAHQANREPDFVTNLVCNDLIDRLAPITRPFKKALIMGPEPHKLPSAIQVGDQNIPLIRAATLPIGFDGPLFDPENLALPDKDYDLILSILDLQFINDVPGFLARIRAHMAPDGLLLLAAIGGNSLHELRRAWLTADTEISGGAFARVAPFIEVRDAGALLQRAGFALPVTDIEHHIVRYPSALALMQDLRALNASNPLLDRPKKPAGKRLITAVEAAYRAEAEDADGRIHATLEILWLSGWAPHESQQKPLKPGSAQISLTKILSKPD